MEKEKAKKSIEISPCWQLIVVVSNWVNSLLHLFLFHKEDPDDDDAGPKEFGLVVDNNCQVDMEAAYIED